MDLLFLTLISFQLLKSLAQSRREHLMSQVDESTGSWPQWQAARRTCGVTPIAFDRGTSTVLRFSLVAIHAGSGAGLSTPLVLKCSVCFQDD